MRTKLITPLLRAFALVPFLATVALAAPTISVTPSGSGIFVLQGSNFANVAGMNVTVKYDTTKLNNPRIEKGSLIGNAMMVPNVSAPGVVRIAVVHPTGFSGSGPIATMSFDRVGGATGGIISVGIDQIVDANLKNVTDAEAKVPDSEVSQTAETPSGATNSTGTTGTSGITGTGTTETTTVTGTTGAIGTSGTTTSSSAGVWLGGVTMSSDTGSAPKETAQREAASEQVAPVPQPEERVVSAGGESEPPSQEAKPSTTEGKEAKSVAYTSVLDRFREFKDEKTPKSLIALFDYRNFKGVRQEPEIALSDGKTKVKVFIELPAEGKSAPNFALKDAKMISITTQDKYWVVEALPTKYVNEASVTVILDDMMTRIPLTVSQAMETGIDKSGAFDEAAFTLFLKEKGTEKAPRFDLNGDGVRNYIDDYIFTANYLVRLGPKAKPKDDGKEKTKGDVPAKPKDDGKTKSEEPPQKKTIK